MILSWIPAKYGHLEPIPHFGWSTCKQKKRNSGNIEAIDELELEMLLAEWFILCYQRSFIKVQTIRRECIWKFWDFSEISILPKVQNEFTSIINLELFNGSCDTASSRIIALTPVLFMMCANCFSQPLLHGFQFRLSKTGHPPKSSSNFRIDETPVAFSSSENNC